MKKGVVITLVAFLLACDPNKIYDERKDPSGNLEWNRNEIIKLDVDIIDTSSYYNIYLSLRYAQGFAYSELKVEVIETSPSGNTQEFTKEVITKDQNGYVGEGMGDIWDLNDLVAEKIKFREKGYYHYEIRHIMDKNKIHMVMEVGLIITKAEN